MAEDFDRCSTANLPLSGALPREDLTQLRGPRRLIDRYGADHEEVLSSSGEVSGLSEAELLEPISAGIPTTLAELIYGVTHEGAHSVDDLLERRTRVALVPVDRVKAEASAQRALTLCQRTG
ncbi:MAG: glycerol-3-phosphate dehydrogenase C-terminal domain-containing protein [Marmoricola sp.]